MNDVTAIAAIIGLILGAWGAILSTILGVLEYRKTKRSVTVILEFIYWVHAYALVIVNEGYRPVTITNVAMTLRGKKGKKDDYVEPVPTAYIFDPEVPIPFPKTLRDGESTAIRLTDAFTVDLRSGNVIPEIFVYDASGNVYHLSQIRDYDYKYGTIMKK